MQKPIYSVHDSKTQLYAAPFVSHNENAAVRSFDRAANDPSLDICMYPADYSLFQLGTFDEDTGRIELLDAPKLVVQASSLKRSGVN